MNAFIDPDNQALLWNLVQSTAWFQKAQLGDPEIWFQYQIEALYHAFQTDDSVTSICGFYEGVLDMNKKALDTMIRNLQATVQENHGMSLSARIDNDTKMKFEGEKDSPLKNLDELVKERMEANEVVETYS